MKASEDYQRAQEILNRSDEETADLIYEMWNQLVAYENQEGNSRKVLEYWKIRAQAAEERIDRAKKVFSSRSGMTGSEKILHDKVVFALNSRMSGYNPVMINLAESLLISIQDKNIDIPKKIKEIIRVLDPSDLVELLVTQGWYLDAKKTQESYLPVSVLSSVRGTEIVIPMEKSSMYEQMMISALEEYSKEFYYNS